ncbi:hypothetical protein ACWEIJ_05770 [Lentzea sp. NPDC004789]
MTCTSAALGQAVAEGDRGVAGALVVALATPIGWRLLDRDGSARNPGLPVFAKNGEPAAYADGAAATVTAPPDLQAK